MDTTQENRKDIESFDEVLNSLYGEPGTPQRNEFRRKANAYCAEEIETFSSAEEMFQSLGI